MKFPAAAAVVLSIALAGCSGISPGAPAVTAAMTKQTPSTQLNAGRTLFVSRCIECHALPAINDHPAAAWPAIVDRMAARADLKPDERQALIAYILAAQR